MTVQVYQLVAVGFWHLIMGYLQLDFTGEPCVRRRSLNRRAASSDELELVSYVLRVATNTSGVLRGLDRLEDVLSLTRGQEQQPAHRSWP